MTARRRQRVVVVLDNEAVSLLTPGRRHDPGRRFLMARLLDATAVLVPTVVRIEADAPRDAVHADLNRLSTDAAVDALIADRAIALRSAPDISVVDACVAAVADGEVAEGTRVELVTSDPGDMSRMLGDRVRIRTV